MCIYFYVVFSLKQGEVEGLKFDEVVVVECWWCEIVVVVVEEMGYFVVVWNIMVVFGGVLCIGCGNFLLDFGNLLVCVVVKFVFFNDVMLQYFIYFECFEGSSEEDGEGFLVECLFKCGIVVLCVMLMVCDYDIVGYFYVMLSVDLCVFVEWYGEVDIFCGDCWLQFGFDEFVFGGVCYVLCSKMVLDVFDVIVCQGEGVFSDSFSLYYQCFVVICSEMVVLCVVNFVFEFVWLVVINLVLCCFLCFEGWVWFENIVVVEIVDVVNVSYGLMLCLLVQSYVLVGLLDEKCFVVDLVLGLMWVFMLLVEYVVCLFVGFIYLGCYVGVSFMVL